MTYMPNFGCRLRNEILHDRIENKSIQKYLTFFILCSNQACRRYGTTKYLQIDHMEIEPTRVIITEKLRCVLP